MDAEQLKRLERIASGEVRWSECRAADRDAIWAALAAFVAAQARIAELEAALRSHRLDGHLYGSRPCPTCIQISKTLGEPFGCELFRASRARQALGGST